MVRQKDVEHAQVKERLQAVTAMNISMQKKLALYKKKADRYDCVIARCVNLENVNQSLIKLIDPDKLQNVQHLKVVTNLPDDKMITIDADHFDDPSLDPSIE